MEQILGDYWPIERAVTGVAALNWGLVELAETNLLTDTIGLSGDTLTGVLGAIGAIGALALYNTAAYYLED